MTWMTLINKKQLLDAVMKKSYSQASIQLINDQPEVKAIPIEWILNWLEKDNKHYCSVDLMLEDWEKENENKN